MIYFGLVFLAGLQCERGSPCVAPPRPSLPLASVDRSGKRDVLDQGGGGGGSVGLGQSAFVLLKKGACS